MKITVMDVMNSKSDVREYLSVHPENGRIYVNSKAENVVLIDKTEEWDELKAENAHLRKALEFYAEEENYKDNVIDQWEPVCPVTQDGGEGARRALKGE